MESFDIILLNMYLFTIFTSVVKSKINMVIYRSLKVVALILLIFFIVDLSMNASVIESRMMVMVRVIPVMMVFFVLVQTEVKALLYFIGIKSGLLISNTIEEDVKKELLHAIDYLSRHKIGAIITFERNNALSEFIDNAFQIEAPISSELLSSIFMPMTPLHDGAIIIKDNIIKCAGAYFPPSESTKIPKYLGSRHRAAIGISEIYDALTIVVSEETGQVSITLDGYLDQDISHESLMLYLEKYMQN